LFAGTGDVWLQLRVSAETPVDLHGGWTMWTITQATDRPMVWPIGTMRQPSDRFDLGSIVFAKV